MSNGADQPQSGASPQILMLEGNGTINNEANHA